MDRASHFKQKNGPWKVGKCRTFKGKKMYSMLHERKAAGAKSGKSIILKKEQENSTK